MRVERKSNRAEVERAIKEIESQSLRVGWNENAKYETGIPVAGVAAQNEFGNPSIGIPPRPFFRPAIKQNKGEWVRQATGGLKMTLSGKITAREVFEAIGLLVAGDVRDSISSVESPPLKEATVKARLRGKKETKGSRKPLVHTANMLNSLTSEVE